MVKEYKTSSQYDPGQVLKNAHDDRAKALKVLNANSRVPGGFTKVILETNGLGSVTKATFYAGTVAQKTRIKFYGDVAGSLSGKKFLLYAGEDDPQYYVWYNVDGSSTDPAIAGKCGIEVNISSNDPASIVTLATKLTLQTYEHFFLEPNGQDVLLINNVKLGMTTPTVDIDTGFFITESTVGATEKIKCIDLPVEPNFIYKFNEAEQKFELIYTGGSSSSNTAATPTIQNVVAAAANTEYSFVIPSGTKKYRFRVRKDAKLQYAFNVGESNTLFMTVKPGNHVEESDLLIAADLTIYFITTKDNQEIELLTWI